MTQRRSPDPSGQPIQVERVRGSRPNEESWRADAQAGSRHSRWVDEIRQPLDLHDRKRAEEICGQVSRLALQDFAPALLLLPRLQRLRVQAITAYALTLFDFARQSGMEGERLAAINRWEFDLESALDGSPAGQPVFVLIHALELTTSWNRTGFDLLHRVARQRCVQTRPLHRRAAEADALRLGTALAWLLLADEPTDSVARFVAAMLRLRGLLDLGDDLRRHRARLPISEIPDTWTASDASGPRVLTTAIVEEGERLDPMLGSHDFVSEIPPDLRAAARYCRRTSRRLLEQTRAAGLALVEAPPRVGLLARLGLLAGSRWL